MNSEVKAAVEEAFRESMSRLLQAKGELSEAAAAELNMLVDDILPLVIEQTRALAASDDPRIARGYLKVLAGAMQASAAKLGLRALATQRKAVGDIAAIVIQVLATVVRTAGLLA